MNMTRRSVLYGLAALPLAQGLNLSAAEAGEASSRLALDPQRPQFHLLPAANWMNDPNGPVFWHGKYHIFYQYNPNGAFWGDMHWGHAISDDMVHWHHLPVALAPTPGGPDKDGCFTGSIVVDQGVPTMLYTGVNPEVQCLAISHDPLLSQWEKAARPVIAAPPAGLNVTGFRDPCLWREGNIWYMGIGSGIKKRGGVVLLYRSRDLRTWEYLHPLATGTWNGKDTSDPVDSGEQWECPDFFPLGGKHVLLYSTERKVYWQSGELDRKEMVFHSEKQGLLDDGAYYAPKSMLDRAGNRILWGWIPETRPLEEYKRAGWAGVMSLPRVLTLNADGELEMRVDARVQALRWRESKARAAAGTVNDLVIGNYSGEVHCVTRQVTSPVRLSLISEAQVSGAFFSVSYHPGGGEAPLRIDGKPIAGKIGSGKLELRLYLDGSVLELFINDRIACTRRIYMRGEKATDVLVKFEGGSDQLQDLSVWQMKPISHNRLTT
ncbi:MAG TPA: glycoside hydrolase family 32 protein [Acidisarcina sp.]|nr:glycoside hydrolase family 32 protein [Acidisarcina sp.]